MIVALMLLAACGTGPEAAHAPAAPAAPAAAAHHDAAPHEHAAGHGGVVQAVGDWHVEAVMMPGAVMFYLKDAAEAPVDVAGFTGSAAIKGPNGVETVPLQPMGDHLHAPAKLAQGQPATVVLTLTKDGTAHSASFETASVGMKSHDHTALHGGDVGMAGNYHVEYAPKADTYRIWLTDEHRNPITTPFTAEVIDGDKTIPLANDGTGAWVAAAPGAGTRPVSVRVKAADAEFSLMFKERP